MDAALATQLHGWKENLEPEGILLVGVFGSRARRDERPDSDTDILYEWTPAFLLNHPGWSACGRPEEIREEMEKQLGMKVDLANRSHQYDGIDFQLAQETIERDIPSLKALLLSLLSSEASKSRED
jgi:predicted nucleotidyltransferase